MKLSCMKILNALAHPSVVIQGLPLILVMPGEDGDHKMHLPPNGLGVGGEIVIISFGWVKCLMQMFQSNV